jgi:SAM-dependent methyltransferase
LKDITYYPKSEKMIIGVRSEQLAQFYNSFDVFLLPSKGEGFGIPIVEAQSCGVPVITTNCTAQPELVGGGWLIKDLYPIWTAQGSWQFECKPEEIVEYLEQAYQAWKDGSISEYKEKAREKALEYEWDNLIPNYWKPTLEDIEKRLKMPKNMEGMNPGKLIFIPQTCIPRKVLDIGCGITQPYRPVLEQLGEYVGIDTREGAGVTVCDAHNLPFDDKEFGFVWVSEMLEHVEHPERVLEEAKRVGVHGVCLFSTPLNPFFKLDPEHKVVHLPYTVLASGDGLISW